MNTQSLPASKGAFQDAPFCKIWLIVPHAQGRQGSSWQRHDSLTQALAAHEDAPVLVEMDDPAWNLAERLACGANLEAARRAWEEDIQGLRDAWRKARRRVTFVGRSEDGTIAQTCMAEISKRLGVAPGDLADCDLGHPRKSDVTGTIRLVAEAMLVAEPTMGTLVDELRAAMIGARHSTLSGTTIATALNEHYMLQTENALLRDTLEITVKEVSSDVQAEHETLKAEAAALRAQLAQQRETHAARAGVLGAQILLDAARITALTRESADLRRELAHLMASKSWRVTAPLRRIRGALSKA